MYNFFVSEDKVFGEFIYIDGKDFNHVKNVLRLKKGDEFLISVNGKSHLCSLEDFIDEKVKAKIITLNYQCTDLPIKIHLFQGLPKSDKLELIIQKAVELGVDEITPVQMERSIVKIDEKKKSSKTERWQSIAESAGKQSKRTCVPKVNDILTYKQCLEKLNSLDLFLLPYESALGMKDTIDALSKIKKDMTIGVLIGPEGGFSEKEITLAKENNAKIISLGKRILRTETASLTTLSMLMLYAEMKLN